jgi:hypothetical protein
MILKLIIQAKILMKYLFLFYLFYLFYDSNNDSLKLINQLKKFQT